MTMRVDFKRGCLWGFVAFAISAPIFFFWLRANTLPTEALPWVALGAAASLAVAALNLVIASDVLRQRRLLSDLAAPVEGEWRAFSGTLETARPLRGPMSASPVSFYSYSVIEPRGSAVGSPSNYTWFEGHGTAPTSLRTAFGVLPIAELPALLLPVRALPGEEALRNFLAWRESVSFTPALTAGGTGTSPDPDADRVDIRNWTGDPDWKRAMLSETSVGPGEEVVIFAAHYAGRGLATSPLFGRPALYRSGEVEADLAKNLRSSMSSAIFFAVVAVVAVALYQFYAS